MLSPAELSRALDVYRTEGTYVAAARAVGRDESTIRRALRRHLTPERVELMGDALDEAHARAVASLETARDRVFRTLDGCLDPRVTVECARALADVLRALTAARLAHARLAAPVVEGAPPEPSTTDLDELSARIRRLADRERALEATVVEAGLPLPESLR